MQLHIPWEPVRTRPWGPVRTRPRPLGSHQIRDTLMVMTDEEVPKVFFLISLGNTGLNAEAYWYNLINNGVNSKTVERMRSHAAFWNHFKLFWEERALLCNRIFNEYKYLVFYMWEDPKNIAGKMVMILSLQNICVRSDQKKCMGQWFKMGGGW
jgi:hypothetical protein